jgi:two-component system OmpR family sensor kinase
VSTLGDDRELRRTARRIGFQAAALILACLATVAIVQWVLVERSSVSDAHARLSDVTSNIDRPDEAPRDVLVTISDPQGVHSSVGMPAGLPVLEDLDSVRRTGITSEHSLSVTGHEYLVRTERSGDRVIQAALDRQPIEEESRRLIASLLWAGLFGLVLAALMAYWLAHRAVAPMAATIALQRRFVADASHELRTPLTLLSTRVQLLSRRLRNDQGDPRDDIEGILADTQNLTKILDELLLAADTRQALSRELLDLASLASDVVESARAEARSRGLDIALHTDGATLVSGHTAGLRRAVVALIDNAMDHAASRVNVRVVRSARRVLLEVEDDGPGIDPAVIPRMFERFASSRGPTESGARRHYGLGLALVSDVASAHGGKVSAHNRAAVPGAVIALELPAG